MFKLVKNGSKTIGLFDTETTANNARDGLLGDGNVYDVVDATEYAVFIVDNDSASLVDVFQDDEMATAKAHEQETTGNIVAIEKRGCGSTTQIYKTEVIV